MPTFAKSWWRDEVIACVPRFSVVSFFDVQPCASLFAWQVEHSAPKAVLNSRAVEAPRREAVVGGPFAGIRAGAEGRLP
jgi:hypothetical protein